MIRGVESLFGEFVVFVFVFEVVVVGIWLVCCVGGLVVGRG